MFVDSFFLRLYIRAMHCWRRIRWCQLGHGVYSADSLMNHH